MSYFIGILMILFGAGWAYAQLKETTKKASRSRLVIGVAFVIIGGMLISEERSKERAREELNSQPREYIQSWEYIQPHENRLNNPAGVPSFKGANDLRWRCTRDGCWCKTKKNELESRRLSVCPSCGHETSWHK